MSHHNPESEWEEHVPCFGGAKGPTLTEQICGAESGRHCPKSPLLADTGVESLPATTEMKAAVYRVMSPILFI